MTQEETVAVLGAGGTMGFAMARNLLRAGYAVRGWNRTRANAEPLGQDGATVLDSPLEAVTGASVILTMLTDGDAVLEAMDGEAGAFSGEVADDAIWLQMSTIGEAAIDRCTDLAQEHDLEFVDAPVLGTKQPAEKGELVILASGPEVDRERLDPIFAVLGQRTMWVGKVGAGTRLKLVTNSWLVTVVQGCAESLALAEGLHLDPQLLLDAIKGGPLDAPYLQMKGRAMIERQFDPSFRLRLAAKDAALVEESARRHGLDLPLMHTIHEQLDRAAREHGDQDVSATFLASTPAP